MQRNKDRDSQMRTEGVRSREREKEEEGKEAKRERESIREGKTQSDVNGEEETAKEKIRICRGR